MVRLRNEAGPLIVAVLEKLIEDNEHLGGMGEYGRGWNDKAVSMNMKIKEVVKKWQLKELG